jgi:hypothetical protein
MSPDEAAGAVPSAVPAPAPPDPAREQDVRHAVIWIGGLSTDAARQSVEATTRRIAAALENVGPARTNFSVEEREDRGLRVCTIVRTDDQGGRPVTDVFSLGASQALLGPIEAAGPFKQALIGLGVVAGAVPIVIRRLMGSIGKTTRERLQMAAAILMLAAMVVGVPLLLAGGFALLSEDDLAGLPAWASGAIVAVSGFGVWKSPPARALRRLAVTLYALYRYVERADDVSAKLRGDLAKLVDDIQNRPGVSYDRIVIVAYSFGSLAALDSFLSPTSPPPELLRDVNELITIGCPVDLIRAFRPNYAGPRFALDGAPGHWTNVYAPSDVLASNFRDGAPPDETVFEIPLRDDPHEGRTPDNVDYLIDGRTQPVGVVGTVLLRGFRLHGRYWSDADPAADSVFRRILPQIAGGRAGT